MDRKIRRHLGAAILIAVAVQLAGPAPDDALAAGGAFAVDDAGVDEPGDCKVETWGAFARNGDRVFAVAPACVFSPGRPVDLGVQFDRSRSGGSWATGLSVKAKTAIVPLTDDGPFGIAIAGGAAFDLTASETTEYFVTVPLSLRLAAPLLLNLNIGGVWDRIARESYLTWGAGIEISLSETATFLGELFGQESERPAAQAGLRYTPHEKIDFDLIYGRNLTGERSDWITFGMNVRF